MSNYIPTSMSSYRKPATFQPEPITKDSRGTEIKAGAKVAYNYSGSVMAGVITLIKNNGWKQTKYGWRCSFEIEIENEDLHISTVKNPNCFIIL